MPLWLTLTVILLAAIFLTLQLTIFSRGSTLSDGYSYFNAWEVIKGGHTDQLRTPVYAVFAGLLTELFGKDAALIIIPIVHWVLYLMALRGIWQIDSWLGITRGINSCVILSLMVIPGFWCLNHLTMAETFSICGIVLLVWLSGKYLQTADKTPLIAAGMTMVMLIFTKPMFIFLIPLMALFWLIVYRKRRRDLIVGGISVASSLVLIAVYLYCMAHTYTVPSLTIATSYNKYYCMRAEGLLIPDEIPDPVIRERFRPMYDSIPGGWIKTQPYWEEMWEFNWRDLDYLADNAIAGHPRETLAATARRFKTSLKGSQFYSLTQEIGRSREYDRMYSRWNGIDYNREGGFIYPFNRYIWFPIWVGLVILTLFVALWLSRWNKVRHFPALPALIAAIYLTAYITTVVGAHDSWGRILTPVNPLLAIMAGSVISYACYIIKLLKREK